MRKVNALFKSRDGGDGRPEYDLLQLFSSVKNAREYISIHFSSLRTYACLMESMTAENHWTYIGRRDDCGDLCCQYSTFCGFIIEEMDVI